MHFGGEHTFASDGPTGRQTLYPVSDCIRRIDRVDGSAVVLGVGDSRFAGSDHVVGEMGVFDVGLWLVAYSQQTEYAKAQPSLLDSAISAKLV